MGSSVEKHAMLKRRVEDRMLEWKCKIENPPRKASTNVTNSSTSRTIPAIPPSQQQSLLDRLPKIIGFGSSAGGSGAPRRSPSGKIQTDLRGHPELRFHQRDNSVFEQTMRYQIDKDQIRRYKEELDKQMLERRKHAQENGLEKGTTEDLATLMSSASGNVIRRWESLPKLTSTDITRNYVNSPRTPDAEEFKRGLEMQLEKKRLVQADEQRQEKALHMLHFSAFDSFWGKPGGGAPKSTKRKENLFNLLHQVRNSSNK